MGIGTRFDVEQNERENIYLNGAMLGYSPSEMAELENDIVAFSELGEFIDMPIKYYSSGMYLRLAFSIATSTNPEILIMDEVLAAGDAQFVKKARQRIRKMIDTAQIVLLASHSMEAVKDICNRVIVLHRGEMINNGPADKMIEYYHKDIINRTQ